MGRWDREVLGLALMEAERAKTTKLSDEALETLMVYLNQGSVFFQFRGGEPHFMWEDHRGHVKPLHASYKPYLMDRIERGSLRLSYTTGATYVLR